MANSRRPAAAETVRFRLDLSAGQALAHYRGEVEQVVVRAADGRRIRFPARWIRPYVSSLGVRGLFEMCFDEHHKLIEFRRIAG